MMTLRASSRWLRSFSSEASRPMRWAVTKLNSDPLAASLECQERPIPKSFAEDAVVVRVRSAAVHWVDLLMLAGQYQHAPPLPYTPGMEYAGDVVAVGQAVTSCSVGDRVSVDIFGAGPRSYGDYQTEGGWSTYSVAPASAVSPVPCGMTYDEAATFVGAMETAHHALVRCADVQPGETVLVHGATGGTGLAAVQICSALGANVIATGGGDDKLATVASQAYGAGKVIATHNYRREGEVISRPPPPPPPKRNAVSTTALLCSPHRRGRPSERAASGSAEHLSSPRANGHRAQSLRQKAREAAPRGVDVVYDTVGTSSEELLRCLTFGGRFAVVGWTGTPYAGGGRAAGANQHSANTIPTNLIMMKGAKVIGWERLSHRRVAQAHPDPRAPHLHGIHRPNARPPPDSPTYKAEPSLPPRALAQLPSRNPHAARPVDPSPSPGSPLGAPSRRAAEGARIAHVPTIGRGPGDGGEVDEAGDRRSCCASVNLRPGAAAQSF